MSDHPVVVALLFPGHHRYHMLTRWTHTGIRHPLLLVKFHFFCVILCIQCLSEKKTSVIIIQCFNVSLLYFLMDFPSVCNPCFTRLQQIHTFVACCVQSLCHMFSKLPSGYVKIVFEMCHRNSEFSR